MSPAWVRQKLAELAETGEILYRPREPRGIGLPPPLTPRSKSAETGNMGNLDATREGIGTENGPELARTYTPGEIDVERPLTRAESRVWRALLDLTATLGKSPTYAEIAAACGIHHSAAFKHVHALKEKGLVRRDKGVRRGIVLTGGS